MKTPVAAILSSLLWLCPQSPAETPQSASFSVTGGWGYGAVPGHNPGLAEAVL